MTNGRTPISSATGFGALAVCVVMLVVVGGTGCGGGPGAQDSALSDSGC